MGDQYCGSKKVRRDLEVSHELLRCTNDIWNRARLNSAWSVGMLSYLIKGQYFNHYHEWEDYYFASGHERELLLEKFGPELAFSLNYSNGPNYSKFNSSQKVLDAQYNFGRTPAILLNRAFILKKMIQNMVDLGLSESFELVKYRLLGETWNGIYIREQNVLITLKDSFPKLLFEQTSSSIDTKYAVDVEVYGQNGLICGIQIKPMSYNSRKLYIKEAVNINVKKNLEYHNKTGKEVYTLLCTESGDIKESNQKKDLFELLNNNS